MAKFKLLGGFLAAILVVGAGIAWWTIAQNSGPELKTDTVKRGDVVRTVDASGSIQRGEAITLAFNASGVVEGVTVKPGDRVEAGTTIAKLDDDEFEAAVSQAQAAVSQAQASERMVDAADGSDDERKAAAAAVNQARAAHQVAILRLRAARLEMPVDGVVTGVFMKAGEFMGMGTPAVTFETESSVVDVTLSIAESDIAEVEVGQPVDVSIEAVDAVFTGKVGTLYPAGTVVEGVPTFVGHVYLDTADLDDTAGALRSAMTADTTIVIEAQVQVLYIPQRAVLTREGKTFVRVLDDAAENGFVEREVELGLRGDEGRVVVLSGLSEGEEIVTQVVNE